jgi:transposase
MIAKHQKWLSGSTTNKDAFSAPDLYFLVLKTATNQQNYAWRDMISRFINYYPSDTSNH